MGHSGAGKSCLSRQKDGNAVRESTPQVGGTASNMIDTIGARQGQVAESVAATAKAARGVMMNLARDSCDVSPSTAVTREEERTRGPMSTVTASRQAFQRKPSILPVAFPSDLLCPARMEHRIEGTTGVDMLSVEGVGCDPKMWEPGESSGLGIEQLPAQAAGAATAAQHLPAPRQDSGDLPAASCEVKIATAAQAASETCKEDEPLHRHASTLEAMISAMAHVPPSVPPECVQGVEISIPARKSRPASSPPRRNRTAAGVDHRATGRNYHHNQKMLLMSQHKQKDFRETEGEAIRRAAVPCKPLLKSFSWTGGDDILDSASGREGVDSQLPSEQRQGRGSDKQRETSCKEDFQFGVNDTSGDEPGFCIARAATNTCSGLGRPLPGSRGGGGGGEVVRGETKPPLTTPFSR